MASFLYWYLNHSNRASNSVAIVNLVEQHKFCHRDMFARFFLPFISSN